MSALEVGKEIKAVKKLNIRVVAGVLLIIAGIVNVLYPIERGSKGIAINGIISLLIFVSGLLLLKFDKWLPAGAFATLCSVIGIIYPIVKIYVYYLVAIAEEVPEWLQLPLATFIPTIIISLIALVLVLKWKFSRK